MTQMHKRGVLAAVICSDPFRTLGTTQSRVLGVPALPLVMIAHPLGGLLARAGLVALLRCARRVLQALAQPVDLLPELLLHLLEPLRRRGGHRLTGRLQAIGKA